MDAQEGHAVNLKKFIELFQYVDSLECKFQDYPEGQHDVIILPVLIDSPSDAEAAELKRLGAHENTDSGCWAVYT